MKKILLISGVGGVGIAAAGTGIGIASSSSSTEKTDGIIEETARESNFDDSSTVSSSVEDKNFSETTKYKPFEEALKEIEKIVGNSNISQKFEEIKKIIDSFQENLLSKLEEELYELKLGEKYKGNEGLLIQVLSYIGQKAADYKKIQEDEKDL